MGAPASAFAQLATPRSDVLNPPQGRIYSVGQMKRNAILQLLSEHGIRPSAQRLAIAGYVLDATAHLSAEHVFEEVSKRLSTVSRATIYNTLHLFVGKGLLKQLPIAEGTVLFDPAAAPHHHFVDEATGAVVDIPWEALDVRNVGALRGLDVHEYQVILRGTRRRRPPDPQ
ncbi:MAG TPA: Fur family transcriptional regulator [Anaeromyxobacteraceae bacterium]|nr:Fur family transcriptional regulator [Anaeromyxobacteraceae bacterium]